MIARVLLAATLAARIGGAVAATAPVDVSDLGAPTFTVFGSQHGLSEEIWSTVGFDRDGFVWAGSASSLARFDGYRWTMRPLAGARSLVRDMEQDAQGNLWAIFEREGLARYDGRAWSLAAGDAAFHQRFSQLARGDGSRELWLAAQNGFVRLDNGAWRPDAGNDTAPPGSAVRIEQTQTLFGGPRQWMGNTESGLWFRALARGGEPAGEWRRFDVEGVDFSLPTDLLRTEDHGVEELWILTYGNGLHRIRDDKLRTWRAATGELPSEAIYSAVATRTSAGDRLLWIASRGGVLRVRGDTIAAFDRRHGLPSDAVRGLKLQRGPDGTDLLWLATEGGLARAALTDSRWQTVSLLGARENGIFAVMIEPDGEGGERLWVGSAKQGVALLSHGAWRTFDRTSGTLPGEGVRGIWRVDGPDGKPWRLFGMLGGQLLKVDDSLAMSALPVPWPLKADDAVSAVLARGANSSRELWFGTLRSAMFRLRDGAWAAFTPDGATAPLSVLRFADQSDPRGRAWLWAATSQGLARFDGERWELLHGIGGEGLRTVALIPRGDRTILWAGSNRLGVLRYDVTDPAHPVPATFDVPAPPDPTVYSVLRDGAGRVYVCTNNGVQQLVPRDDGGYDEHVFRRRDGLVHDECNTGAQVLDAHDRYWVGTLGGLSVYDPRIQAPSAGATRAPLYFTDVVADGAHLDPHADSAVTLPPGIRELRVDFALLSGQRELESEYRSRLVGYDPDWSAWSGERLRAFTGLPPGAYRLEVEARGYAGASAARALAFDVPAAWWQRSAVRLSFGALALLFAAAGVLLYNRNLRARQRALKREVAARTAELATANERLVELSYADALTGVANRRRLTQALEAAIERAAAKSLPLGLIVIDVDHFKDYNDRFGHLAGDVALRAIAQALETATRAQDLVARFGGEEFACLMLDAPMEIVAGIAERMRALVEALPPRALGNDTQTITISAGALSRVPDRATRADDLLRLADAALYEAKRAGRNRVVRAY